MDRQFIARELGMVGGVCPNSMDAVSDRDYVVETIFMAALLQTHLSRWGGVWVGGALSAIATLSLL